MAASGSTGRRGLIGRRSLLRGIGAGGAAAFLLGERATSAAAAPAGGPSYAPASAVNQYDSVGNVYNWKAGNTRKHRAGLAAAASGGLSSQVFIGDSLTSGCIGGTTFDRAHAWPRVYAATLASLGVPVAGTGLVRIVDGLFGNAAWTLSGWTANITYAYATTPGATATFVSSSAGTSAAVAYAQGPSGGTFTISVDGATTGPGFATVDSRGGQTWTRVVLGGLPDTAHTITITATSSAPAIVAGAEVFTPSGLVCHNVAQSGSSASGTGSGSWSDTATGGGTGQPLAVFRPGSGIYGHAPSTVHCALGINDLVGGASVNDVINALATIRVACPQSDFFLYLQPQPNVVAAPTWQQLATAMYTLADAFDVPLFDLQDRFGGYAIEAANGLAGDAVAHLDVAGHADWGRSVALTAAR